MMRWIVGSSLKFRFIVIAVAAALMYFGIARLNDMPVVTFRNIDARLRPTHTNKGALRGVRGIEARGSVTAQALSLLAGARVRCVRS